MQSILIELDKHPTERDLIGKIVLAYGVLEVALLDNVRAALGGDINTATRAIYRLKSEGNRLEVADALVREAALYDRQGCLSPSIAYLEASGAISPEDFAERCARAQARWAERWPVRRADDAQASLTHRLGQLDDTTMRQVCSAVSYALGC